MKFRAKLQTAFPTWTLEDYTERKVGGTMTIEFYKDTDCYGVTFADLEKMSALLGTTNINLSGTRDGVPPEDATDMTSGIVKFEILGVKE